MLFMFMNGIYFLVGIFPPFIFHYFGNWLSIKLGLVFSPRSDMAAFGKSTPDILHDNPSAQVIKKTVYIMLSGLYLAYAILHACLIYYGLMVGQKWTLWALTISDFAIIVFYLFAARNFSVHLATLKINDLMPFALIPGFVLPFASFFGYLGMYSNNLWP